MIVVNGKASSTPSDRRGPTFTGEVWADPVLASTDGVIINTVMFTPGAHTFWHSHERGQILQVTAGEGLVCSEGAEPIVIRAGDTIWTAPGERHWHGATPDSMMTHTAISLGSTDWLDEVSSSDYTRHSLTKDSE